MIWVFAVLSIVAVMSLCGYCYQWMLRMHIFQFVEHRS